MLRTVHSAHQLSVYEAVSSWCMDLAEKMHGQTSTGVDRSISEENARSWSEGVAGNCWHVHWQRVEMMNPDEQFRTVCEEAGFIRTVSNGMYNRTGEDVNDGY